jgi:hypothetical protein
MKIGADYPKIEWEVMGYDLLEPNAFIGDTLIAFVAMVLFFKSRQLYHKKKTAIIFYGCGFLCSLA